VDSHRAAAFHVQVGRKLVNVSEEPWLKNYHQALHTAADLMSRGCQKRGAEDAWLYEASKECLFGVHRSTAPLAGRADLF